METGNKLALFLVLALSSHLLHYADADDIAKARCAPRTFRYLEPSSGSPTPPSAPAKPLLKDPVIEPVIAKPLLKDPVIEPVIKHAAPATKPVTPSPPETTTTTPSAPSTPKPTPAAPSTPVAAPSTPTTLKTTPSASSGGTTPTAPELKKICDASENPDICMSYIPPFVKGKLDPDSIIIAEINALRNHTQVLLEQANKITADPETDPDVVQALDLCKENYDSVISNIEDALKAVEDHDKGTLNSMISGCLSDISTCQDTFLEVTPKPSPLGAMDDIGKKLCIVNLATVDYLKW